MSPLRISGLLLAAAALAEAGTVINFDGTSGISGSSLADIPFASVVGSSVDYDGVAPTDRRGLKISLTAGSPLLASSSDYTGPDIYGAYETIVYNVGSGNFVNSTRLLETAPANVSIRAAFRNGGSFSGGVASGFYMFLTGGSGISFDVGSSLSLTTGAQGGGLDARWIVRDGSSYYISSSTFASAAGTTTNLLDPNSTTTWALYNPAGTFLNFDQATATFASHTFTNVTAAGIYFEDDTITADLSSIDILKFSVDAVPEPGSTAALLVGLGLSVFLRRRSKG